MIDFEKDSIELIFTCPGQTSFEEILSTGTMSYNDQDDYLGILKVFALCYHDPLDDKKIHLRLCKSNNLCFQEEAFEKSLLEQCKGKEKCTASIPIKDFAPKSKYLR